MRCNVIMRKFLPIFATAVISGFPASITQPSSAEGKRLCGSASNRPCSTGSPRRLVICKIGGSCCTDKRQFESAKEDVLAAIAKHVDIIFKEHSRTGDSDGADCPPFLVVIHGAGSFGHFQAQQFQLKSGGLPGGGPKGWVTGVSNLKVSLGKLSTLVLGSLTVRNLPAVLVSPWPYTCAIRDGSSGKTILPERDEGLLDVTTRLLQDGFIPVLHGDVILNNLELSVKNGAGIEDLGREPLYRTKPTRTEPLARDARCTILSGDRLALMLAKYLPTKLEGQEEKLSSVSCVFLTDVEGVYDSFPDNSRTSQPKPSRQGGGIIREILVSRGGDGQVAFSSPLPQIQDTAAGRPDVTGGITGKLNAASQVAALGVPVHIVQAGSESALEALGGLEPRIGTTVKLETCTQKVQREYAQI